MGTAPTGADVLRAATLSLARQHTPATPGSSWPAWSPSPTRSPTTPRPSCDPPATRCSASTRQGCATGSPRWPPSPPAANTWWSSAWTPPRRSSGRPTPARSAPAWTTCVRSCARAPVRGAPARLVAGLRRLADDLGGTQNRDDVACLVALNVPGAELALHLGAHDLAYTPRADRALLIDRHDQRTRLIVPFVGDGHESDGER
ncbi:hypothetical protein NKG94_47935 [Micromonospora sp. M12]